MEWIIAPWPWYVSGPLIALTMFSLLYVGKNFGMSSNLRTLCTICGAGKTSALFRFDWKSQRWNLMVMVGGILGGFLASQFLSNNQVPDLNSKTIEVLHESGFKSAGTAYVPSELFGDEAFTSPKTIIILLLGGLLVGFGARSQNNELSLKTAASVLASKCWDVLLDAGLEFDPSDEVRSCLHLFFLCLPNRNYLSICTSHSA